MQVQKYPAPGAFPRRPLSGDSNGTVEVSILQAAEEGKLRPPPRYQLDILSHSILSSLWAIFRLTIGFQYASLE